MTGRTVEFTNIITIRRPADEVFGFLARFENVPKWNHAVAQTRKTSTGPVGVGCTFRQVRSRTSEESFEIDYEPDQRLEIRGDFGPYHFLTYELEAVAEGTRLTNCATPEGRGLLKLAAPIAGGRVRDAVAANLGELKAILER